MNLTPQRKHGESFEAYQKRRKYENTMVSNYLRRGRNYVCLHELPVKVRDPQTLKEKWAVIKGTPYRRGDEHKKRQQSGGWLRRVLNRRGS